MSHPPGAGGFAQQPQLTAESPSVHGALGATTEGLCLGDHLMRGLADGRVEPHGSAARAEDDPQARIPFVAAVEPDVPSGIERVPLRKTLAGVDHDDPLCGLDPHPDQCRSAPCRVRLVSLAAERGGSANRCCRVGRLQVARCQGELRAGFRDWRGARRTKSRRCSRLRTVGRTIAPIPKCHSTLWRHDVGAALARVPPQAWRLGQGWPGTHDCKWSYNGFIHRK
jgi:hypothetical protein